MPPEEAPTRRVTPRTAVPTAVAASRHRRVTRRCTTKTPGVSLIAAATPISTPRGTRASHRGRGSTMSSRQSRTMNALTCPNRMPSPTGCSPQHRGRERGQRQWRPGPRPVDQAVPGVPDDRGGGHHLGRGPQPPGHPERHQRQRHREERRERRVGERQQLGRLGHRRVDLPPVEDRHPRLPVDVDVDLPLVQRPEHEVAQHDGERRQDDDPDGGHPPLPRVRQRAPAPGGHRAPGPPRPEAHGIPWPRGGRVGRGGGRHGPHCRG